MNEYLPACSSRQTNFFEEKIYKICSLLNNASFGTFCISIGQLLELHWVFEGSVKSAVFTFLKQNQCKTKNFLHLQRLSLTQAIDKFGRKRYQMKHYLMGYTCNEYFASKYFV